MRLKALVMFLFLVPFCGWAAESAPEVVTNTDKPVWIVPLTNQSEARYANSAIYRQMVQRSLVSFIGLIPGLATVDLSDSDASFREGEWPADAASPDYVVTGSYRLTGDIESPELEIELRIYGRDDPKSPVFTKNYRSETGLDLFDALDLLTADAAKAVAKTDVNIAQIRFSGFEIGDEPHLIFLNGRLAAVVTNNDFVQALKIPADTEYQVEIRKFFNVDIETARAKTARYLGPNARSSAGWMDQLYPVKTYTVKLAAGKTIGLSYQATGKIAFYPVRNARNHAVYSLRVNDKGLPFSTNELVLPSGTNYRVSVVNGLSNEICVSNLYLYSRYDETDNHDLFRPANPYWKMVPQEPGVLWGQPTSLQSALKIWYGGISYGDASKAQVGAQINLAAYFSLFEGSWNPVGLEFEALNYWDFEKTTYANGDTGYHMTENYSLALGYYLGDWGNFALKILAGAGLGYFDDFCGSDIKVVTNYDEEGSYSEYVPNSMLTINLGLGVPVKLFSWLNWDNTLWFYTDIRDYHVFRLDSELQARWSVFVFEAGLSYWAVPGYREVDFDYNIGDTEYFAQALMGYAGLKVQFDF